MAGGLKAHTNPYLEAWATNREHIERTFRWTPRSLAVVVASGVLVPLLVYKVGVAEYVRAPGRVPSLLCLLCLHTMPQLTPPATPVPTATPQQIQAKKAGKPVPKFA
jgi:hypothetical protein